MAALLAAFLATQYGYAWRMPFFNDDYVFLDLTRGVPFRAVWEPHFLWLGRYYRPWSRELHYWTLQHLFGAREVPLHLASFALWLGTMVLYFLLARRLAGGRAAGVATAGAAAAGAWALPIVWAAGAQDLWMIGFALSSLLLLAHGRTMLATLAYGFALLSKETAALLPAVALAGVVLLEGLSLRAALRRVAPLLAVGAVWAASHPQFGGRLWLAASAAPLERLGTDPVRAVLRTLLAVVNLDGVPRPEFGWLGPLLLGAAGALCLAGLAAWTLFRGVTPGLEPATPVRRLVAFAAVWALAGWLPLLMPSVGWHAFYGLFGLLGAWLLLGVLLARRPAVALTVVVALALLRPLHAATVSRDWGEEWYQRRAAGFLDFMRRDLLAKIPAVAPHSRLFFVDVPTDVGFMQGDGPALRIWYGEPTLTGALFSKYRTRPAGAPAGPDRFFRYDSTAGWIEVHRGPEDVAAARAADPLWREDHERLAVALSRGDDWPGAAAEYAKLAGAFRDSADYGYYAGLAALVIGDTASARTWLSRAAAQPTADEEIRAAARGLGPGAAPRAGPGRGARGTVRR